MPITREFIYGEDPDFGVLGFKPAWMANGNHVTDVAHDVLEHFGPNAFNAVEDEFLALGALLALRIETGALNSHLSYTDQLATNVMTVFNDLERYELERPRAKPSRRLMSDYDWADNAITHAARKGLRMAQDEYYSSSGSDAPGPLRENPEALIASAIGFMREGYRRTLVRFDGCDVYTVGTVVFRDLSRFSERVAKSEMLAEGDVVRFCVTPRSGLISVRINGEDASDWF